MNEIKESDERRATKRFHVPRIAFVALRPHYVRVGQIVNISSGGLAFRYVASEALPEDLLELDLFLAGSSFYLYKIPSRVVSDSETAEPLPIPSMNVRQRSVKFEHLTSNQRSQLEYFIDNYTLGESTAAQPVFMAHQPPEVLWV